MAKGTRFTDEFKTQIVTLYKNGRAVRKLSVDYDIAVPTIYKWIKEANTTGSFKMIDISLRNIRLFHTDRGKEFDNKIIDNLLKSFEIKRSLSRPGNPYDNAVAEATFKTFKTEFCNKIFECIEHLEMELFEYVNWYNKYRLHSSLGYQSPIDYRKNSVYSNFV